MGRRAPGTGRDVGITERRSFCFRRRGLARGVTLDNLADMLPEFLGADALRYATSIVRMCDAKPDRFIEIDKYLPPKNC